MQPVKVVNPLLEAHQLGQSIWLDYISRDVLTSGQLKRLIEEDGLCGVTSNPAIFEKAISGSVQYDGILAELRAQGLETLGIYERLAVRDIRDAADAFRPLYQSTGYRDGYVSLEVSPFLAYETQPTIDEARRLWREVDRPNLMIKVPGTREGLPAIERLLGEGVNVNVTLLFSRAVYEEVARIYVRAATRFGASGGDVSRLASVASFFVSRIDVVVDGKLAELARTLTGESRRRIEGLTCRTALANAKLAYRIYEEIFSSAEWKRLANRGCHPQRLLWASTTTKNKAFSDVLYVDELIGPDTVNTLQPVTLDLVRDHGKPAPTLTAGVDEAARVLNAVETAGISLSDVTGELVTNGVKIFSDAFHKLLNIVDARCAGAAGIQTGVTTKSLPKDLEDEVNATLEDWHLKGKVRRLWAGDSSLWTGGNESEWLGWLRLTGKTAEEMDRLRAFAAEVKAAGFRHVLLLGMGGSSLCPEVFAATFGPVDGFPRLLTLDSTDPAQVRAVENSVDVKNALFIVASKSGSTLEPNVFLYYFYERVRQLLGRAEAPRRFVAITDPGSKLEEFARREGFRHVFHGIPSVGGRFSALSNFGLVPAAAMGLDVERLLDRAHKMAVACCGCRPAAENPGAALGAILGVAAKRGRDKLTIMASPALYDLGAWLEQLVAESTGKNGKAIIPVDREEPESPSRYGNDRVFAYIRYQPKPDAGQDAAAAALEQAGQPVVRIPVADLYDVGQEFFRWEIATAVAGAVMGIHPFNQPDVEASKIATRELTAEFEQTGKLPEEMPFLEVDGLKLFAAGDYGKALLAEAAGDGVPAVLRAHLGRLRAGDYFALLGYLERNAASEHALGEIRHAVLASKGVATCLGFGPRFLHSTGQAYKGGPATGVFLQVTCDDASDLPVPGQKYSFGLVKAAQARGDFQVLVDRGRRALRVHLPADVGHGLKSLYQAISSALG